MRKLLLSTAATIFIAGPALAADLGVRPAPAAPAFIATPWDGFYIGGNLGFGSTDFTIPGAPSLNGSGVLGGFQTGYNKQFGTFVLGFETDLDLTSIKNTTDGVDTKLTWFGTTRTRAGVLINPLLLLYGTGGVAYGRVEESVPGASLKTPGVGWAAGAGVQYALTPQWSIGAEYLHVDLDRGNANVGGVNVDLKATTNLGRATLNYKF
ncbi:MAG TPA: outer membrane protein [Myxococcaceae bacterium]|nr:outer membrane protein [Myxococcaceae bacterium]